MATGENARGSRVYGFIGPALVSAVPHNAHDVAANAGWVNVGIDHGTVEFAAEGIRRWWREMGTGVYPHARRLLVTADCDGGTRVRVWRRELQKLADELQLTIQVCHIPPGTSKWNKIEHSMFFHVTANWRGGHLVSRQVVVNLIGHTTAQSGPPVKAVLDEKTSVAMIDTDDDLASRELERDEFHGEWNYRLHPRVQQT
jgi:hypothetical protein